jgi:hypothetical protein
MKLYKTTALQTFEDGEVKEPATLFCFYASKCFFLGYILFVPEFGASVMCKELY